MLMIVNARGPSIQIILCLDSFLDLKSPTVFMNLLSSLHCTFQSYERNPTASLSSINATSPFKLILYSKKKKKKKRKRLI
jgi:hypothetical protein